MFGGHVVAEDAIEVGGGVRSDSFIEMIEGILEVEDGRMWNVGGMSWMKGARGNSGGSGEEFGAEKVGPGVGMTSSEMRVGRMSGARGTFGGKLVRADVEEMKVSTFVCRDVVEP